MHIYTLRRRLFKQLLWPLTTILLAGAVFAYLFALRAAMDAYDLGLLNDALDLSKQVEMKQGQLALNLPLAAQQMLQSNNQDRESYAAWDDSGHLFAGNAKLLQLRGMQPSAEHSFDDITLDGEENRAVLLRQRSAGETYYVAVSQTMRGRDRLTDRTFAEILFPEMLLAFVSIAVILLGVRQGLSPVEALRDEISSRSSNDLRPIEEASAPAELTPIIHGINELMAKLATAFAGHRRFIADAAHQLRTPLASLSLQIELALEEHPSDVRALLLKLLANTQRTTHISNQLLSLAKLEHTENLVAKATTVDLEQVFLDICGDFVSLAARKNVDISFDLSPLSIEGSTLMFREMLANLLDNAVLYTPPGGKIDVQLFSDLHGICLRVANNGATIPDEEIVKLGMPFHRLPSSSPGGCGLGLAIIKEIARAHGGRVHLDHGIDGGGLEVRVQFLSSPSDVS